MRPKNILAVLLIILGSVALAYQGITYKSRGDTVDLGAVQVTAQTTKHIPLSPVFGAISLVGGIALLIMDTRKA